MNQLLPDHRQITDISYKKNEQLGNGELDRMTVYDIFCKSTNGEEFIVKTQRKSQRHFKGTLPSTTLLLQPNPCPKKQRHRMNPIFIWPQASFV